jgi:hypothetical protein
VRRGEEYVQLEGKAKLFFGRPGLILKCRSIARRPAKVDIVLREIYPSRWREVR